MLSFLLYTFLYLCSTVFCSILSFICVLLLSIVYFPLSVFFCFLFYTFLYLCSVAFCSIISFIYVLLLFVLYFPLSMFCSFLFYTFFYLYSAAFCSILSFVYVLLLSVLYFPLSMFCCNLSSSPLGVTVVSYSDTCATIRSLLLLLFVFNFLLLLPSSLLSCLYTWQVTLKTLSLPFPLQAPQNKAKVLMGIFHLGFVSMYLSEPVLDGFATGASVAILTAQVKYLVGIKIPRAQGYGVLITTWVNIFCNISQTNLCDVITSMICIAVLVTAKELGDRYKHKLKVPLPTELVVIVMATLVSHYGQLKERYGSSVSGEIPTGFIPPQVPSLSLMQRVAVDALPLAIVGFAFTVSLSEMFAKKYAYTVKANQEMFAIGFCNIIPAFFHCFATSAALAKSLVKASTGCQTQVSSLVSAIVVLLVLLFFAPLFFSLQKCVLACIIIVSLRGALRKFKDIPQRYRLDKVDALVWCVTMLSSALISTEMGLLVGVAFSVLCIIGRTQRPHAVLLGQIGNTVFYEDDEEYKNLLPVPNVKIFRFEAPLYYANKDFFLKCLHKKTGLDPAMELARRKKAKKKGQPSMERGLGQGDTALSLVAKHRDSQAVIIDCSSIPFLDTAGVSALKETFKDHAELKVTVLLACCNSCVIASLERGGYAANASKDMHELVFHSIHSAVQFVRERKTTADDSAV